MKDENDFQNTEPNKRFGPVSRMEIEQYFEESKRSREEILQTVSDLSRSVREVRLSLDSFKESTADLVTVFNSLKGLSNILVWLGKIIKPLLWIGASITAINLYMHGVKIPKITQ